MVFMQNIRKYLHKYLKPPDLLPICGVWFTLALKGSGKHSRLFEFLTTSIVLPTRNNSRKVCENLNWEKQVSHRDAAQVFDGNW